MPDDEKVVIKRKVLAEGIRKEESWRVKKHLCELFRFSHDRLDFPNN